MVKKLMIINQLSHQNKLGILELKKVRLLEAMESLH